MIIYIYYKLYTSPIFGIVREKLSDLIFFLYMAYFCDAVGKVEISILCFHIACVLLQTGICI